MLTTAQRNVLEVLAASSCWMTTGQKTIMNVQVNGHVVRKLEVLQLTKSRVEDGKTVFTVTRKGMCAVGYVGEVFR